MASHILLYHGVTKIKSYGIENYSNKHISLKKFEEQMKFLKKFRNVVPLKEIKKIKMQLQSLLTILLKMFSQMLFQS